MISRSADYFVTCAPRYTQQGQKCETYTADGDGETPFLGLQAGFLGVLFDR